MKLYFSCENKVKENDESIIILWDINIYVKTYVKPYQKK